MDKLPERKDCNHHMICKIPEDGMCPMECGYFEPCHSIGGSVEGKVDFMMTQLKDIQEDITPKVKFSSTLDAERYSVKIDAVLITLRELKAWYKNGLK